MIGLVMTGMFIGALRHDSKVNKQLCEKIVNVLFDDNNFGLPSDEIAKEIKTYNARAKALLQKLEKNKIVYSIEDDNGIIVYKLTKNTYESIIQAEEARLAEIRAQEEYERLLKENPLEAKIIKELEILNGTANRTKNYAYASAVYGMGTYYNTKRR